jgi:hypothetical protein
MMEHDIVSVIQAMLAPGLMISACGLLLLAINNKYSMVVNRIRVLDEEIRKIKHQKKASGLNEDEENRYDSTTIQTKKLNERMCLIRNAVISYSVAVGLFLISCLFIGMQYIVMSDISRYTVVIFFLLGMLSVFIGVIFAIREVYKGYEIMQIEIDYTENLHKQV